MNDAIVLLSYHPTDEAWKDRVRARLSGVADLEIWPLRDDAEGDWLLRREEVLRSARAAVLLVSTASLASEYLADIELPLLDLRHRRGEVEVIPILVEPCPDHARDSLAAFGTPRAPGLDGRSLSKATDGEVDCLLDHLATDLRQALARVPTTADPVEGEDLNEIFDRLYSEHFPNLVVFFGRRGLDPDISRELAQDTLLKVYQGLSDFEGRSKARTWILKIATNVWRNWVRDHRGTLKRQGRENSLEEAREDGVQVAEDQGIWRTRGSDPERQIVEKQAEERVRARISELAPRQRDCLVRWLEGASYQEIADELKVSIQTVRASLHKAKTRIEKELRSDFQSALEASPPGEAS